MEWTVVKKISTPDFDIEAGAAKIGEDILLYIQGGDKPHIGCTVMAVPRPSLSGNGLLPETDTFAVIGATIADNFNVKMPDGTIGYSVMNELK